MKGSNNLNSVQMGLVTFISQTGVGIIILPSIMSKEVGHDGWITIIITGILIILLSLAIIYLLKRYKDKSIYDINNFIYGKVIGTAFNILLLVYLIAATAAGTGLFSYFMRITILSETPSWALTPLVILPSFYLVWQGLKSISRFLYVSIFSYVVVIILLIVLYKEYKPSFLMPIGEAGITHILMGIKSSFFAFIGFELVAFFYPYISNKEKVIKQQLMAIIGSIIFFVIVVCASVAVYGENFLSILTLPFFNISRVFNAPILERIDLYLTALWFIPTACSIRSYVFAAYDGLQKVFKIKKTKVSYVIFFICTLVLGGIPRDINQIFSLITIINASGAGVTLFLIICLLLSFIRRKGVVKK